jgi:hypothetical protein
VHGLSDITLAWMLGKAIPLGLEVDPVVAALYAIPDGKHALDQLHESWSILWAFPHRRPIADTSSLSNSVQIRCAHESGYKPGNLTIAGTQLATSYNIVNVVSDPD